MRKCLYALLNCTYNSWITISKALGNSIKGAFCKLGNSFRPRGTHINGIDQIDQKAQAWLGVRRSGFGVRMTSSLINDPSPSGLY